MLESFCLTICEILICARFDDAANKEINKTLVQNVMAVNKDDQVTPCIVKRKTYCTSVFFQILFGITGALRVYFKSKKSQYTRKRAGKHQEMMKESRKRQRRHNVSDCTVYIVFYFIYF